MNPIYVIERVKELLSRLRVVHIGENPSTKQAQIDSNARAVFMFSAFILYNLSSRKVILQYRLFQGGFSYLLNEIENAFNLSQITPGEMSGSIAAQSLGETMTQMTLNTFHFAGVSSQNITLGVPRIQELINVTRNIKGPAMTIYLSEESKFDQEQAHKMISFLEFTTLGQMIISSEIIFDPVNNDTVVPEDQQLVCLEENLELSQWVLRLTLDPIQLGRKGIYLSEIISKIRHYFPDNLQIIDSLESSDPIVIRLRLLKQSSFDYQDIRKIEQFVLHEMGIKGFCKKVSYRR